MARTANEIASDVFGALTLENITLRAQVEKLQEQVKEFEAERTAKSAGAKPGEVKKSS